MCWPMPKFRKNILSPSTTAEDGDSMFHWNVGIDHTSTRRQNPKLKIKHDNNRREDLTSHTTCLEASSGRKRADAVSESCVSNTQPFSHIEKRCNAHTNLQHWDLGFEFRSDHGCTSSRRGVLFTCTWRFLETGRFLVRGVARESRTDS
jgi:hypothetical protein